MDLTGKTVWQQASGDTDRSYAEICLKWDVILNGPGYAGPWPRCEERLRSDGRFARKLTDLRRFCKDMKPGHLVVLRLGTSEVIGLGEVVGEYEWHQEFGDIDGWPLEHVRRVRWLWKNQKAPMRFDTYALKLGDTTQRLTSDPVTEWLSTLRIRADAYDHEPVALPESADKAPITFGDVSEHLFNSGIASATISRLLDDVGELERIAKWYENYGMPSEHETAEAYATGKVKCRRLIVTDGLRYGVFLRDDAGEFNLLHAYMNLTRLRSSYPIYECRGAEEALIAMAPEWRTS